MIELFHSSISAGAATRVADVLRSGRVSEGERVREFEQRLEAELGLVNPVALNSGTSALHLALVLAGVGQDDEVILPAQTFVATGHAVLMQRAVPVFADINPLTGNIDAASVRAVRTRRTKAVIAVHWAGYPCDLQELGEVADSAGIAVIEDAAHALGAAYRDRPVGSVSRFTCFSFQAIKHLTTADGGALCCSFEEEAVRAKRLRWFGIDRAQASGVLGEREGDIVEPAFKYHMNDVAAAIGLANLDELPEQLARRRAIVTTYRTALASVPGITLLRNDMDRVSAAWLFTLLVERRADFVRALRERGVAASVVHRRIDRYSAFGGLSAGLEAQTFFDEHQVSIPLHGGLSAEDVSWVTDAIRAGW
jgi:perosamine synthetase